MDSDFGDSESEESSEAVLLGNSVLAFRLNLGMVAERRQFL